MRKIASLVVILLFTLPIFKLGAQTVDLLWQGEIYVSPFYKGRSLWSSESRITFVAIPHGLGNPANLNYKWIKNGTVLGNINGIGKNTLSFMDSILSRPQTIEVDIISQGDTVLASASVFVAPTSPVLAIYENSPLYGFMFHKETSNVHELKDKEVTFTAFPLFFSVLSRADNAINYKWSTNIGGEAEIRNSVTYRAPDDATGASQVEIGISNTDKITQSAGKSFLIQFGK
ncbi:MAG: hypothetical protein Q7K26_03180 [bacterium]|nr:hypothetical protein [bacterium]